jgi:hypothetical protein
MKRTSSQMQEICLQWEQSGESRRAFCKQHNIAYQTFNYWYKRMTNKEGSGFSQISVPAITISSMELTFPSGARITFQAEPSVSWLRELVG